MIADGGWILALLAAVSLVAWTRMALEWLAIRDDETGGTEWADEVVAAGEAGDLGTAHRIANRHSGLLARVLSHAARRRSRRGLDFLEAERLSREARLDHLAIYGAVAPLLGLLGTLIGMVTTFDALSAGDADERMAAGISRALITTQAGLVVAVPILVGRGFLVGRLQRLFAVAERYHQRLSKLAVPGRRRAANGEH